MLFRLLLIVAIAGVVWYLYRRIVARPGGEGNAQPPQAAQTGTADSVTRCAECGVHVPEKNGVRYQEKFFCGPEHLNDYLRKNSAH